LVIHVNK